MDFEKVKEIFGCRGKESELSEYEASYHELIKRIKSPCKADLYEDWGDPKRVERMGRCPILSLFEGSRDETNLFN